MPSNTKRQYTIAPEETSIFCEQVALILSAGMPMHDGIEALSENYASTRDAATFKAIAGAVNETGSLSQALAVGGIFPKYMVEMTAIGEKTGKLEAVMQALATYYMRESKIRRAVKNAVAYPLILMVMMACVIAILISKVLPIFDQALGGLGLEMGDTGSALMRFGMTTGRVVMVLVGVLVVAVLAVVLLLRTRQRKQVMDTLCRVFPPIGRLNRRISAARFASVMAMMMGSGFPMEEALKMMPSIITDEAARVQVEGIISKMDEGVSFPDALDGCLLFDPLHTRMIRMGYLAGQVDTVMEKVAGIYEEEVDEGISRLVSIIEPSLVALLSVVIGAILLSVMLPMASIISSIV